MHKPYSNIKIEDVRKDIIGLKVVDFELDGDVIYLTDKKGRSYVIDNTGDNGAKVSVGPTKSEKQERQKDLIDRLVVHLGIDVDELYKDH